MKHSCLEDIPKDLLTLFRHVRSTSQLESDGNRKQVPVLGRREGLENRAGMRVPRNCPPPRIRHRGTDESTVLPRRRVSPAQTGSRDGERGPAHHLECGTVDQSRSAKVGLLSFSDGGVQKIWGDRIDNDHAEAGPNESIAGCHGERFCGVHQGICIPLRRKLWLEFRRNRSPGAPCAASRARRSRSVHRILAARNGASRLRRRPRRREHFQEAPPARQCPLRVFFRLHPRLQSENHAPRMLLSLSGPDQSPGDARVDKQLRPSHNRFRHLQQSSAGDIRMHSSGSALAHCRSPEGSGTAHLCLRREHGKRRRQTALWNCRLGGPQVPAGTRSAHARNSLKQVVVGTFSRGDDVPSPTAYKHENRKLETGASIDQPICQIPICKARCLCASCFQRHQ